MIKLNLQIILLIIIFQFSNSQIDTNYNSIDSLKIYNWNFHREFPKISNFKNPESLSVKINYKKNIDIFDKSKIKKNGMIYRGISLSTVNDLTVQSGMRLDLSGNIIDDIYLSAALSDQNLNNSLQSSTQKIKDVDNIFINLKGNNFSSTIGDVNYIKPSLISDKNVKKIQGIDFNYEEKNYFINKINFALGTSKGKFKTAEIIGIENVQGPYRIYGNNFERNIIIVPNSEVIYIDGKKLIRGQSNDYIIDYSNGEINFTYKNVITKNSRIIIDYEFNDNSYVSNYYDFTIGNSFLNNKLQLKTSYSIETDDENNFIENNLNEEDKKLLQNSNNSNVKKSTVIFVGKDSTSNRGKGNYELIDSLIDGNNFKIYNFMQNGEKSFYNINFTFVGFSKGNYERNSFGNYYFVGINKGGYDTLIYINAPKNNSILTINSLVNISEKSKVSLDLSINNYNQNKYFNNTKSSKFIKYSYSNSNNFLDKEYLKYNLFYGGKFIDNSFLNINRITEVERNRNWGIDSTLKNEYNSEFEQIVNFNFENTKLFKLNLNYGVNDLSSVSNSKRNEIELNLHDSLFYKINIKNENIILTENNYNLENNWNRFYFNSQINYGILNSNIDFQKEKRAISNDNNSDSLHLGSFSYNKIKPELNFFISKNISLKTTYEDRVDFMPEKSTLKKYFNGKTYEIESNINYSSNSLSTIAIKKREGKYFYNNETENSFIIHSLFSKKSKSFNLNLTQDISSEKIPLKEKVFYQVRKGEGMYEWIDENKNGIIDFTNETDFRLNKYEGSYNVFLATTDKFEKMKSSNTIIRFNLNNNIWENINLSESSIIKKFSANYYFKNEIKSRSDKNLFDLNFNNNNILFGNIFLQQDYFYNENSSDFNLRFRLINKNYKNSLILGAEENNMKEYNLRLRFANSQNQKQEIEFLNSVNKSQSYLITKEKLLSLNTLNYDYSELLKNQFEFGLMIGYTFGTNQYLMTKSDIQNNIESIRISRFFDLNSQIRITLSREEILLSNYSQIPQFQIYEITSGKNLGISYNLDFSSEAVIYENFQLQCKYLIRRESNSSIYQHFMANIKAFF